ncbi:hypothetical protein [Bradyrhizobium sp.]|uniref:hypothetical protein n=1 Tax=Bradyrhizobium sp. TaxID=376 RepID=UPI002BE01FC7|nr:hypothetical protein [Bradyrhizobium sp.]HWX62484.1 hypothetical protein [Bradyrhizobium sp.]
MNWRGLRNHWKRLQRRPGGSLHRSRKWRCGSASHLRQMPRRDKAAVRGWDRNFDDPIPLPDGSELRTLRDAGNYIATLPKREYDAPAWQAAIQALMLVVEHVRQTLLARIAMMRALYRHHAPEPVPRKKRVKKHRIIR